MSIHWLYLWKMRAHRNSSSIGSTHKEKKDTVENCHRTWNVLLLTKQRGLDFSKKLCFSLPEPSATSPEPSATSQHSHKGRGRFSTTTPDVFRSSFIPWGYWRRSSTTAHICLCSTNQCSNFDYIQRTTRRCHCQLCTMFSSTNHFNVCAHSRSCISQDRLSSVDWTSATDTTSTSALALLVSFGNNMFYFAH